MTTSKIFPIMHTVLNEELERHPEKDKEKEERAAALGQELLNDLWLPEEKPATFWGKIKSALSDEMDLPQKLFKRMIDFRVRQGLAYKKEEMQKVAFYATKSFRKGTDLMARACYLFYHNPQAFEKYATTSIDFKEDIQRSSFNEENVFMPALAIFPSGTIMATGQAEQEYDRAEDGRLPLLSFAPIKCGIHPSQIASQVMFNHYQGLFSEPSLYGFSHDSSRYEPLKKLLYEEHPESNYPDLRHKAIVVALNAFNQSLERETVHVCTHKDKPSASNTQKIKE